MSQASMKDWLRLAGAPQHVQEQILGHVSGGVGENYGGYDAMLKVHAEYLEKARQLQPF